MGSSYSCAVGARTSPISPGEELPDALLDRDFPPRKIPLSTLLAGKKVVMVGLPGAFTPT